jgi:hypothetical protein
MGQRINIFVAGTLSLVLAASCAAPSNEGVQSFDLKKIAAAHSEKTFVGNSEIFEGETLQISPEDGHNGIVIWESGDPQNWTEANYLVFEIFGKKEFSGVINIEFYKDMKDFKAQTIVLQSGEISGTAEDMPWISSLMGILPRVKTQVVFPLSYLDAQNLFVPRSPRQLKGTVSGDRLDPADIIRVVLRFGPFFEPYFLPEYEIASISVTKAVPEPYPPLEKPVVDLLGQWTEKEWKGKLSGEQEMIALNRELEKELESVQLPDDWSRYGGWKEKRFEATGYFRTQHDGKRWWLVDPDGYVFLSTGVDGISYGAAGPVNGIEDLLEWLPEDDDPTFGEAVSTNRDRKSMSFHVANMIRVWGGDWKEKWTTVTQGLMRKLRFNTIGNWSNSDFVKASKVPYVFQLNRFPTTEKLLYRDFPDVFDPQYKENSVAFAQQLVDRRDDPYMIGYFLRNEPQWAFGYHNLAYEMFATDQQSVTKDEFVKWLADKYAGDVAAFNKAWALELKSFDDIKPMTFKAYPSETADKDFYEFSTVMVMMYVDIPCDEVKKIDDNHLNLGMRYAWLSSDMLYKAGERFDVFSINGYGIDPPPTEEIARRSGKPVIIGEFHHGAVDRALPATGIIGVLNQDDRAAAFRNYIEQGFARPELVGMHYFQWVDQPWFGRGDGENYNIGVVTSANLPYPELSNAMRMTNERIYRVASGDIKPFKAEVTIIPPIHY